MLESCTQNKWEHVSERALDDVLEHLNTLNDLTPKIKCQGRTGVDPSLIFGLDSKLFLDGTKDTANVVADSSHHDEVETATIWRGAKNPVNGHVYSDACNHADHDKVESEPDHPGDSRLIDEEKLEEAFSRLSKETVYRVKGFVRVPAGYRILNWAFGRYELHALSGEYGGDPGDVVKFTMMGERGEVRRAARKLAEALEANVA